MITRNPAKPSPLLSRGGARPSGRRLRRMVRMPILAGLLLALGWLQPLQQVPLPPLWSLLQGLLGGLLMAAALLWLHAAGVRGRQGPVDPLRQSRLPLSILRVQRRGLLRGLTGRVQDRLLPLAGLLACALLGQRGGSAGWDLLWLTAAACAALLVLLALRWRLGPLAVLWRELQVLRLGDDAARLLGLDPARLRLRARQCALALALPALLCAGPVACWGLLLPPAVEALGQWFDLLRRGGGGALHPWPVVGVAPLALRVLGFIGRP